MPELPEVETVRRSLLPRLVGGRVASAWVSGLPLRVSMPLETWRRRVVGARLADIGRRGKVLLLRFEEVTAVIHLGMSGRLLIHRRGEPRPLHTHLVLLFDRERELRFVDPRRFGVAVVVNHAGVEKLTLLSGLGPDPLDEDCEAVLLEAARRSRSPIRNLLIDQRVVAGIGNIYANEALARATIHPARRASAISRRRLSVLWQALRQVLADAIAAGGTTLADGGFVDGTGNDGYFAVSLAVYDREGQPCQSCGTAIWRRSLTGRSVFYCPRCQR